MIDHMTTIEEYRRRQRRYHRFMGWVLALALAADLTVIGAVAWRWLNA